MTWLYIAGLFWVFMAGVVVGAAVASWHAMLKLLPKPPVTTKPSVRCHPEQIRPPRGSCGILGCAVVTPHSHVQALAEKLRQGK